jgi:CheY-like chemotaxis protein/predicted regulator of Ras-like GTPase activity (Roadblock/LC7/MglB family)
MAREIDLMTKRILVVEDDINVRRIVTMTLNDETPYTVTAVSSAEAALLHITRQPVDLIFTDISMPGMSGIDLVQRVRDLDLNTAVIIFTANPDDLSDERAAQLKIDYKLEKPVSAEQLRQAVDLLLDPMRSLGRGSSPTPAPPAPPAPPTNKRVGGTNPLTSRIQAQAQRRPSEPLSPSTPIAMRLTPRSSGISGRNYSNQQIEDMRQALKELALEPDVHCAILLDMSGMVLTHWSRRRDINVTVIAALAVGNSLALSEIARNMGQQQPSQMVIQEGFDQNIIMAQMEDLLLLLGIGANASLGWARIATLRACEAVLQIARSSSD